MTYGQTHLVKMTLAYTKDVSPDDIQRLADQSGTAHNLIRRMWRRYFAAHEASRKYGFVGVECISFAENRLTKYVRRIERRFGLRAGSLLT